MTDQTWAYDFPDDNLETLEEVVRALPEGLASRLHPNLGWGWRLDLPDFAAVHLKLAGFCTLHGEDFLTANECCVPFNMRAKCEAFLKDGGQPTGLWTHLVPIRFADEDARIQWEAVALHLLPQLG